MSDNNGSIRTNYTVVRIPVVLGELERTLIPFYDDYLGMLHEVNATHRFTTRRTATFTEFVSEHEMTAHDTPHSTKISVRNVVRFEQIDGDTVVTGTTTLSPAPVGRQDRVWYGSGAELQVDLLAKLAETRFKVKTSKLRGPEPPQASLG